MPFLCSVRLSAPSPSSLRKGSIALKAGTRDDGPRGPTASCETAVRSAPGRSTECGVYKGFAPKRKRNALALVPAAVSAQPLFLLSLGPGVTRRNALAHAVALLLSRGAALS